jgi:hypothetical protein
MVCYIAILKYKLSVDASTCSTLKLCPSYSPFLQQLSLLKTTLTTGVEFLTKNSVFNADPQSRASVRGIKMKVFAGKEVIMCGGVSNLPQLLKLSGIGQSSEVENFNIQLSRTFLMSNQASKVTSRLV